MRSVCVLAAVAAAVIASPTAAAQHLDFTGIFSSGPNASLSGTVDYELVDGNFTLLGSTLTVGSTTITEDLSKFYPGSTEDLVLIGNRAGDDLTGTDNYFLTINLNPFTGLFFDDGDLGLYYSTASSSSFYTTYNLQLDTSSEAVPEPATWAMMLLGFGAVGYSMRRKRIAAVAPA